VTKTRIDIRHEQPIGHSLLELSDHPCLALKDRDVRGLGEKRPKLAARIPIYSAKLGVWSAVQYRPRRSPDWLKMMKNSTAPAIIYLSFT